MRFATLCSTALLVSALGWIAAPTSAAPAQKAADSTTSTTAEIGKPAPQFTLKDTNGKSVSLSDFKGKTVVIEWFCPTCPYSGGKSSRSIHSTGQVKQLMADMKKADDNAVYLLIDSSTAKMRMTPDQLIAKDKEIAKARDITAPILIDADTKVAAAYGAKTTPHCYVIDGDGVLRYMGAFSDMAETNYVLKAVTAIKNGSEVSPSQKKPWGCGVKIKK
ncbi:MAG: redoxin domain-containing protein [Planctomycetota bacterium]|nr:redoxin domain-containing protein [Planctomycetota bacterium]